MAGTPFPPTPCTVGAVSGSHRLRVGFRGVLGDAAEPGEPYKGSRWVGGRLDWGCSRIASFPSSRAPLGSPRLRQHLCSSSGWHGVSVPLTWGVWAPGLQALFNLRLMHLPSYHQNRAGAPQGSNRGPLAKASPPPPALVIQVSYPSGWWLLGARRPGRPGGRRGSPLKEPPALSPAGRAPALGARPLAHRLQSRGDGSPHWEGWPQPGPACGSQSHGGLPAGDAVPGRGDWLRARRHGGSPRPAPRGSLLRLGLAFRHPARPAGSG